MFICGWVGKAFKIELILLLFKFNCINFSSILGDFASFEAVLIDASDPFRNFLT